MVLAMVLRRKPDVMINLLPTLKDNKKYQGQDKLPVTVWVIAQASQGDLVMGLYLWVSLFLPMLSGKSGGNPQSRDLILQLVERILSFPKARVILLNGAIRKGKRVVPPSALDSLLRVTFPLPSARIKVGAVKENLKFFDDMNCNNQFFSEITSGIHICMPYLGN